MLGFMPVSAAPMAALGVAIQIAASAGAYQTTGQAATWDRGMAAPAGAYAVTGQDAELDPSLFFRCQTGDFATAGQPARFRTSITHGAGAYQTTGQAAGLQRGFYVGGQPGAYQTTGQPVIFRVGVAVIGDAGAYQVSGQNAAARYVLTADGAKLGSASPQWPMASQPMSSLGPPPPSAIGYLVQGQAATLRGTMFAGAGAYHLTGYPVRFIRGPVIRGRGRDLSGPLVLVLDRSAARITARDLSGGLVAVRDASEGLP